MLFWYPADKCHAEGRELQDEARPHDQGGQRDVGLELVIYPVAEDKEPDQRGQGQETERPDVAQKPPAPRERKKELFHS